MTKLSLSQEYPDITFELYDLYNNQFKEINSKIDLEIQSRISKLGFDITDTELLKLNFEFISTKEDKYKHLVYLKDMTTVISIQKNPTISFDYKGDDILNNKVTCSIEYKYY